MNNTILKDMNVRSEVIGRAVQIWKKAQVVYQSPFWDGKPEARALAEHLATEFRESEENLAQLLTNENQLIVAYALMTLQLMGSKRLRTLPAVLLERRSKITVQTGSFSTSMDLGGLARQIQKSMSESASSEQK